MLWEFPKPAIRPVLKPDTVLWELHFVLSQFRTDRIMRLHPVPKQAQTAETTSSMLYVMFVLVECEHNLAWDAKSVCNLFRSQHSIITTWNCDQVPNSGQIAQKYLGKLLYLFSILEIPKGKKWRDAETRWSQSNPQRSTCQLLKGKEVIIPSRVVSLKDTSLTPQINSIK